MMICFDAWRGSVLQPQSIESGKDLRNHSLKCSPPIVEKNVVHALSKIRQVNTGKSCNQTQPGLFRSFQYSV